MTLITNATLVEFSPPRVRNNLDVLIEDDAIKSVGTDIPVTENHKKIDAKGKIVFPGLVCAHHHFYSGLSRGILSEIGPTPDFVSTLRQLWWRVDRALDEPSLRSSALVSCLDAIRSGTTTVIDHHSSPSYIEGSLTTIGSAFEETGLRGATCFEVTDRNGNDGMREGVAENVRYAQSIDAQKKAGSWSGLIEANIGGHAPFTLSNEALEQLAMAVAESGRGFHCHVGEDRYDVAHSHAVYGNDLLPRLDEFDLLNEKTILAHGTHLSADEVKLVNTKGTCIVHDSRSNMNNGVGYNYRLADVDSLALGTDGIGGDMFEEVKFAYFKHRDEHGTMQPGDFLDALAKGNTIIERMYGAKFGQIEAGYQADIIISDYPAPTPIYPENLAGHLVFGMGSSIVETVIIKGRTVMENRKFPFDTETIFGDAREQAERLWRRVNMIEA